jgi:pantoate kinase
MKEARAFCPSGISSFFQPVTLGAPPTTFESACRIGARGGGFILSKGVHTRARAKPHNETMIHVTINGIPAPEAKVTREVCSMLLDRVPTRYALIIDHRVEVPIGAGFGTSAAGAVSTGLALVKALGLHLSLNQIGQLAHVAEIRCATGLGTVSGVLRGGAILILEAGAPGFDYVDWLPVDASYRIVAASFAPIPKENILFSRSVLAVVNEEAEKVMSKIQQEPDPALFLRLCYNFAQRAGFMTPRVKACIEAALAAGAVGASQNQIGEAFHALVERSRVDEVVSALEPLLEGKPVIVSQISRGGPF